MHYISFLTIGIMLAFLRSQPAFIQHTASSAIFLLRSEQSLPRCPHIFIAKHELCCNRSAAIRQSFPKRFTQFTQSWLTASVLLKWHPSLAKCFSVCEIATMVLTKPNTD